MALLPSWHKIWTYGDRWTKGILDGEIEITEKIDGSQFNFGKIDGVTLMRSKGADVFFDDNNKMFNKAKEFVKSIEERLPDNVVFHGEYLQSPRHNTLAYSRVPRGNFILFGVTRIGVDDAVSSAPDLDYWSKELECEAVPVLGFGHLQEGLDKINLEYLHNLIPAVSVLGGCAAEGIVIKNYNKSVMVGDRAIPILQAKIVSADFKEKHGVSWSKDNPTDKAKIGEAFKTEARWDKAIQYLRDNNKLTETVKDIGPLIKRIQEDIVEEDKENIKEELWKMFNKDVLRVTIQGFPEYYKGKLVENIS